MRKVVLGVALSLSIASMTTLAEEASQAGANVTDANCADFSVILNNQVANITTTVTQLLEFTSCTAIADQIVETAISLAQPAEHQSILQAASDTGVINPTDALIAAIAGGGDVANLFEPTAAGSLALIPASAATAPPVLGGRNGGAGLAIAASNN
ncbi:MAG: hypothetical protein HRT38_04345 [Alteromonadaceae bacterium]|nr:hypothetical protein [Alteromonadaceae bacterium]